MVLSVIGCVGRRVEGGASVASSILLMSVLECRTFLSCPPFLGIHNTRLISPLTQIKRQAHSNVCIDFFINLIVLSK